VFGQTRTYIQSKSVIIDLPQAVNAAGNNSAGMMLERDVDNMATYFGRFAPELLKTDYGKEIWGLYVSGNLQHDTPLTGHFERSTVDADVAMVMQVIDDAREEEAERRQRELAAREYM
jgi:RIO kinase 1